MDTIRNYVDMMFKDLPKSKEVIDMKLNILDNMEDKYNELRNDGKTENEAIGAVISQFGNIDELMDELGIKQKNMEESNPFNHETIVPYKDDDEVLNYLSFKFNFAYAMALGVALCIISLIPPCFDNLGTLGNILFFMLIAMGVAIFIIGGIKNSEYEEFEKHPFQIRNSLKEKIAADYQKFYSHYGICMAIAVVLCILSPMMYLVMEFILEPLFNTQMEALAKGFASASLFICIAPAVFMFIVLGMKNSAYEFILKNAKKVVEKKQEEDEDHITGFVMSIVGILYLFLGFCFGWWHPGWILFPLAAILTNGYVHMKRGRM